MREERWERGERGEKQGDSAPHRGWTVFLIVIWQKYKSNNGSNIETRSRGEPSLDLNSSEHGVEVTSIDLWGMSCDYSFASYARSVGVTKRTITRRQWLHCHSECAWLQKWISLCTGLSRCVLHVVAMTIFPGHQRKHRPVALVYLSPDGKAILVRTPGLYHIYAKFCCNNVGGNTQIFSLRINNGTVNSSVHVNTSFFWRCFRLSKFFQQSINWEQFKSHWSYYDSRF